MIVPDPALAFRETRRVLRPGGRLAFATWAPAKRNPWATIFGPVLVERGLMEPPQPGEPGQFALGEPARIEELVRAAGFEDVGIEEVGIEFRLPGWEEYRRLVTGLAASLRQALGELDDPTRTEVDEAARRRFEEYRRDGEYVLPGLALVTRAD